MNSEDQKQPLIKKKGLTYESGFELLCRIQINTSDPNLYPTIYL